MSRITREAWLAAFEQTVTADNDPDALTMDELAAVLQVGRSWMHERAKKLIVAGKLRKVIIKRQDTAGRWRRYNGYVLLENRSPTPAVARPRPLVRSTTRSSARAPRARSARS